MAKEFAAISGQLQEWFKTNKRPLPWRQTQDPYHIWLSEIILQQTRVAQGLPYYLAFIKAFPTVQHLARADEQVVLKLWQGLGYYSRARNLHATAKEVAGIYNGIFPSNHKEILKLKGIGHYTAAAILSIAYNKPFAVLDGNVYRVLSRLFYINTPVNTPAAQKQFTDLAQQVMDKNNPGLHNESIMELGAMVCLPQNPLCPNCPVQTHCCAYIKGLQNVLPVKITRPPVRNRYFHYFIIKNKDGIYLKKRGEGDIWQGLYDLPMMENDSENLDLNLKPANTPHIRAGQKMVKINSIKHKLTHQTLFINFYLADEIISEIGLIFVPLNELREYPLPKPIDFFLRKYLNAPELF